MNSLLRGLLIICFLSVNYRCTNAAGNLFNAFGTIIGIDNEKKNNDPLVNNNNKFQPNTGFNNNFGGRGLLNNKENSRFQFNERYNDADTESSIASKLKLGNELSEDEKLAAEKFPGIKNLLDKLKELNRQKELQKQKENEKNGVNNGGLPDTSNNGGFPNINNSNNNGGVNNGNGDAGNDIDADEEKVSGNGDNKWLKLKKRKFFFQVRPVRPEDEIVVEPEVVYYLN